MQRSANHLIAFVLAFLVTVLTPVRALAAGSPVAAVRNAYATTNVTTAAYVTLVASLAGSTSQVVLGDSSGQALALSFAATCGALASNANSVFIWPSTAGTPTVVNVPFAIPAGWCVGIKALVATANTGELDLTLLR